MFTFSLKRNTNNPILIQTHQAPDAEANKDLNQGCSTQTWSYCSCHLPWIPREAQRDSFTKIGDFLNEETPSPQTEHASKTTRLSNIKSTNNCLPLFFPRLDEEGRHHSPPKWEFWKQEVFRRWADFPHRSTLFINGKIAQASPPIQNFNPQETGPCPEIFSTTRSSKYQESRLHDLILHEVKILVINLSPAFNHSNSQIGIRMRKGILTSPFEVQKMPQLPEPGLKQSVPLFLLGAWRKRKQRGLCSGQDLVNPRNRDACPTASKVPQAENTPKMPSGYG